mgnify:CR=1 FL=1
MKSGLRPGAVYEFSLTVTPEMQACLSTDTGKVLVWKRCVSDAGEIVIDAKVWNVIGPVGMLLVMTGVPLR